MYQGNNMTIVIRSAILKKIVLWLKYVELAGAAIVTFSVGILLGQLAEKEVIQLAEVIRLVAIVTTVVIGGIVVYLEQYDKRKFHSRLVVITIGILFMTNFASLFDWFIPPVINILVSLLGIFLLLVLFTKSVEMYKACSSCKKMQK